MIDLGSALGKIIIDADDALKSTEKLGGAMSGLMGPAGAMGGAVLAAGAAAGGALVALGASSVGIASEFQSSMAIMSTAVSPESLGVHSTAEAMAILSDASLAVGSDTALVGVSASSASEAMTGLYKAGLSTGEIFGDLQGYLSGTAELGGALRASIDLAAASELDMVQASDLAAITLATFGGGLETTEERAAFVESAMNNFVQTADASVASVSDLQAAFVNVGPTAAALGFGVEDVNTALGILSTRGIAGSEAGTALKSMLTNMMRDTPAVTGALNDLGISLYDMDGNMRPLPDIIGQFDSALNGTREVMVTVGGRTEEQNHQLDLAMKSYDLATDAIYKHEAGLKVLSDSGLAKVKEQQAAANAEIEKLQSIVGDTKVALQDMTQEQRNQYITTIAGTYGMNAMNSLLAEGVIGWEEMEAAVGEAATMQETAAARTATLAGAQEALGGVWESFQIKIGTALIPALMALADIGSGLLETYGPALTAVFEAFGVGIARIIEVVSGGQLGELFTVFEDGSSVLGSILEAFGMGAEQANNLAIGISNVVTAVMSVVEPIANAVTQFISWKDVMAGLVVLAGNVLLGVAGFIASVLGPMLLVFAGVTAAIALLRTAWENNWGGIQEKVQSVIGFIVPLVQNGMALIQEWWATNGEVMLIQVGAAWMGIQNAIGTVITWIQTNVMTVIGAVISWWNANWPTIQSTIQTVWGLIQSVINSAIAVIRPAIETLITNVQGATGQLGTLAGPLQELWAKIGPFIQSAATIIGAILTTLVGVISGIVKGIAAAVEPLIRTFVNLAENVIVIVGGIIDFLGGFFDLLIGLFTGNGEKMTAAWDMMGQGIKEIVDGLVTGVWELFTGLVETVATLLDGFITGIIEYFQNLYDELVGHSIVPDLINDIVSWFEDLITWIGDTLLDLWDTVRQPFVDMWTDLTTWFGERVADAVTLGSNIVQGLINGILAMGSALREALQGIATAAWNAVSNFWETGSPSRLMNWLGRMIGGGLILGIDKTRPGVEAAAEGMTTAVQGYFMSLIETGDTLNDYLADIPAHLRPQVQAVADMVYEKNEALHDYLIAFYETGDALNDFITDLPADLQPGFLQVAGLIDQEVTGVLDYLNVLNSTGDWLNDELQAIPEEYRPIVAQVGEMLASETDAFRNYINAVVEDGDYLNDWLMHLPEEMRPGVLAIGQLMTGAGASVDDMVGEVVASLGELTDSAAEHLAAVSEAGALMAEALIENLATIEDPVERANELLSTLGDVGSLGSGFARFFQDETLGPLKDELDNVTAAIEDMGKTLDLPDNFMTDPFTTLRLMHMRDDETLSAQQRDTARVMLSFMEERSRLNNEYIEQQERLAALEEKQAQASFLKQQLELLNLIRENNLDASILEGLTLGLDADAGDLMDAMSAAMLAMIAAAEDTLGIASPSKVFRGIARNVKEALTLEMADRGGVVSAVRGMVGEMVGSAQDMVGQLGERVTDASRTLHVYGGVHAYLQQPRRGVLDDLQEMMSP